VILTIGVSLAQLSAKHKVEEHHNSRAGFIAVLSAACTSGFSGVYFERILKNSRTSLWMRNIQMGISSIILGFVGVFLSGDGPGVMEKGFFYGYSYVVVAVILLQVYRLRCIYVGVCIEDVLMLSRYRYRYIYM
jgi:UDP-sugar transporter A1/2/3